jgi:Tfp pilus assembly protein PilF
VAGLALGCAGTNGSGPAGLGLAQNGAGAFNQTAAQPKPTWTQRIMAPFGGAATPAAQQQAAQEAARAAEAKRQQHDPISLGFQSGPLSPQLYIGMAEMSSRGGNVDQARQLYQKALAMDPKHLDALLGAAHMEDREGNLDVALMLYQRAAAAHPYNPTVFNDLGLCLARRGQLPEAERALAQAAQLEPAKPLYRNNLAKVQVELNRLDSAVANLAAVYQAPVVNYNMGALLRERGRNIEAEQYLTRALAIDPQMQPARLLLAELRQPTTIVAPPTDLTVQVARASAGQTVHTPTPQAQMTQAQITQAPATASQPTSPPPPAVSPVISPVAPVETIEPTPPAAPQIIDTQAPDFSALERSPMLLPPIN